MIEKDAPPPLEAGGRVERRHDTESRDRISDLEEHYQAFQERVRKSMVRKWVAIAGLWLCVFIAGALIIDGQRDNRKLVEAVQQSRFENARDACERTNAQNRSIRFVLAYSRKNIDVQVDSGELTRPEADIARGRIDEAIAKFPVTDDCVAYARLRVEAGAQNRT